MSNNSLTDIVNIFIICPVREADPDTTERIKRYVSQQESLGKNVYWPARDTDQNDPIGLKICKQNCEAIWRSNEIHVWYTDESQGTKFDFGMAFLAEFLTEKTIRIINKDKVKPTPHKSFANVLIELDRLSREKSA